MARSLNKVTLIGNVGGDPDIRTTGSGARVAKLSLATSRNFKGRDEQWQERTEWHRLTIFGRLVDVVEQWVRKGNRLYIEGRLEYSTTEDNQGGTRYWTDIIVSEMIMLGSGSDREGGQSYTRDGGSGPASSGNAPTGGARLDEPDDDLPF